MRSRCDGIWVKRLRDPFLFAVCHFSLGHSVVCIPQLCMLGCAVSLYKSEFHDGGLRICTNGSIPFANLSHGDRLFNIDDTADGPVRTFAVSTSVLSTGFLRHPVHLIIQIVINGRVVTTSLVQVPQGHASSVQSLSFGPTPLLDGEGFIESMRGFQMVPNSDAFPVDVSISGFALNEIVVRGYTVSCPLQSPVLRRGGLVCGRRVLDGDVVNGIDSDKFYNKCPLRVGESERTAVVDVLMGDFSQLWLLGGSMPVFENVSRYASGSNFDLIVQNHHSPWPRENSRLTWIRPWVGSTPHICYCGVHQADQPTYAGSDFDDVPLIVSRERDLKRKWV